MYLLTDYGDLINMARINAIVIRSDDTTWHSVVALFDGDRQFGLIRGLTEPEAKAAVMEISESYLNSGEKSVLDLAVVHRIVTA